MFRWLGVIGLSACVLGCAGNRDTTVDAGAKRMVRVDWYGHQCFRITSALGTSILTNPFAPGTTAFSPPKGLTPEIILVTNEEADTNYIDLVENSPNIYRGSVALGTNTSTGIRILGLPIYADPDRQDISGMGVVFRWQMDGLRFVFLGELDRPLTQAEAEKIGPVDLLFLPVSGTNLSAAGRAEIVNLLQPRAIIPMGSTTAMRSYASGFPNVYALDRNAALVSREALPQQRTVLLFRAPQ